MATERYFQPEAFAFEAESGEAETFGEAELGEAEYGEAEYGEAEFGEFGAAEFGESEFAFVGEAPSVWELESTAKAPVTASVTCPPPARELKCLPRGTRPNHILDHFGFNRSDVNRVCHTLLLNEAAERIIQSQRSRQPIKSVLLVGHTDKVGSDAYNVGLGRRRANAVLKELCKTLESKQRGITRRITFHVASCGESQPKATPDLSRRVEIFLPVPPQPRGCPPFRERIRIHLKILVQPRRFTIARMLRSMRQVYEPKGFIVEVVSCEIIRALRLNVLDIHCPGTNATCCPFPCATATLNQEHVDLFRNRNNVGANELAVYFVRRTQPGLNGCCAHPIGSPGVIVAAKASQWTLAHEIAHVLGLPHVRDRTRLMIDGSLGGTNALVTPPLPVLTPAEVRTMTNSALTVPC